MGNRNNDGDEIFSSRVSTLKHFSSPDTVLFQSAELIQDNKVVHKVSKILGVVGVTERSYVIDAIYSQCFYYFKS
jgi:hypothetical protein